MIRSQLLPGFQFRRPHLYELPALEELALDEVYQGYVLLKYQAAVAAAEAATAARQLAEDRLKEIEAELARLRRQSS